MGDGSWWFTKCMNEGFKYARRFNPEYVLALNDDVEIKDDYLTNLIKTIHKVPQNSIVGSVSYTTNQPYKIINSGVKTIIQWRNKIVTYHPFLSEKNPNDLTGLKKTCLLPSRGTLIPYNVLETLRFYDERFIQYHSDSDFCLRATKKGFSIYISYDSPLFVNIISTSQSSSFINIPFIDFIRAFFSPYSRLYLPSMFLLSH